MKKIFSILIAVTIIAVIFPLSLPANAEIDFTCGDNLIWSLDVNTGVLTITGKGKMYDYCPWRDYTRYVKTVFIDEGVTNIGEV